ncbi:unnamed protein product [Bathycoccus prasinos]
MRKAATKIPNVTENKNADFATEAYFDSYILPSRTRTGVLHALFLTTETTMHCNNNNDDDEKKTKKKKKENEYRVLKITDNGFCGPLTMTKEKTFQLEKHPLKGVRPPLLVTKYASVWEQKKYNNNVNDEFSSEEGEHYRDVLSLARMSEQFQSRVVALHRVKELSSSIQALTTTTTDKEEEQQQQQQQKEREEDVDFLLATHIFAPGSMKAKHVVQVLDGTIAHNRGNEKSVIKKKREVYALTTALRSLNGLARYVQMPPMKEEDKKETHERLRAEAKRKRCLVLQSKKTIIEAYKEMMLTTPKSSKMADEKKTSQQKSTVVEKGERQTSATTKETKEQQQTNRSEKRKEEKPQHENKVVAPKKTVVVVPVVATNLPPKGRKQKRTPFSPPRIFGQEITNNN